MTLVVIYYQMNYRYFTFVIWVFLLVFGGCTGQNPIELKKSTNSNNIVSAACSSMKIEGKVLTKENILNIFECSGWSEKYTYLFAELQKIDEKKINNAFLPLNEQILGNKVQQNKFFKLISKSEENGRLDPVAKIIEKVIANSDVTAQFRKFLEAKGLSLKQRNSMLKMVSSNNQENLRVISALKSVVNSFENNDFEIRQSLKNIRREELSEKFVSLLDDVSSSFKVKQRLYLANVLYQNGSLIKTWSEGSVEHGSDLVNSILLSKDFYKDMKYLDVHLNKDIECNNDGNKKNFLISINQDIINKIHSLKNDPRDVFQSNLLHGMSVYLAFQSFCDEEKESKGLKSFFNILNYSFNLANSENDFNFLKKMHLIFGEDNFAFLRFLTTPTFLSLRDLLIELRHDRLDLDFVSSLHRIVARISIEDWKVLSDLVRDTSIDGTQGYSWIEAWSSWWPTLSLKEKIEFINLISLFFEEDTNSSQVFDFVIDVLNDFPGLSEEIFNSLGNANFQSDLVDLLRSLEDDNVQKDLARFLSNKGIFEFFKLVANNSKPQANTKSLKKNVDRVVEYQSMVLENTSELKNVFQQSCFDELGKSYLRNPSYYSIVNSLPDSCQRVIGDVGFVGLIYIWMNEGNKLFAAKYMRNDFHSEAGVWSPAMLHFIFSLGLVADKNLFSTPYGHGLKNNLTEIGNYLLSDYVQDSFSYFANTYLRSVQYVDFEKKIQDYVELKNDQEITELSNLFFDSIREYPKAIELNVNMVDCKKLDSSLGADTCLSPELLKEKVMDIVRILKAKNNRNGLTLIQGLIEWIHPDGGINLPLGQRESRKVSTNLEQAIMFLYDLSGPSTMKNFNYYTDTNLKTLKKGTAIDRLEVLIREIGFKDNFYGSYFKNNVAHAKNYRSVIEKSESLLAWMDRLNGVARLFFGLPASAVQNLKTMKEVYSSLVEVADSYHQADGSVRSYDDFIQGLLSVIVSTSRPETQNFNPYQKINTELARGHNGVFLTRMVEISALRHLSQYVKSRIKSSDDLKNSNFIKVNSNLFKKMEIKYLQNYFQDILEKYVDGDRGQLNLIVSDLIDFVSSLNPDDLKIVEEILFKSLIIISDDRIKPEHIKLLLGYSEVVIKMWPEISSDLKEMNVRHELLEKMNNQLDAFVSKPELLAGLLDVIKDAKIFSTLDLAELLSHKDFRFAFRELVVHFSVKHSPQTQVNWSETFRAMFTDQDIKWQPLINWLSVSMDLKPSDKLTVSVLMSFLSEKENQKSGFKRIVEDLFINHKKQFNDFLENVFPALRLSQ